MLRELNAPALYLICGVIIAAVIALCAVFLARAWRAGIAMGMDRQKLRRTVVSSASFTLLPSVSILLGVIALSGSLGTPLPWLRLSVIGALHYETSVADIAARGVGMSSLNAAEMTARAFSTIALVMTVGILFGTLLTVLLNRRYTSRLQRGSGGGKKGGFGDAAMNAMFIGLVCAYVGSFVGTLTSAGDPKPLLVTLVAALAMAGFVYLIEKKRAQWLQSFSVAGSMLIAMAAAVAFGMLF